MIRQTVLAAALTLSSLAAPAFAKDAPAPAPAAPAPAATADTKPSTAATRRYCVVGTPTGSHIERKTCKTRAQWLAMGVDPLAKND